MAEVTSSLDGSLTVIALNKREVKALNKIMEEHMGSQYPDLEDLYDALA